MSFRIEYENFVITGDENQYILNEKRENYLEILKENEELEDGKKGKDPFKNSPSYFSRFDFLLNMLLHKAGRQKEIKTLEGHMESLKKISEDLKQLTKDYL